MKSNILTAFAMFLLISSAQAGIVITNDNGSRQYFQEGALVLVENGQPKFGVDADGNCWFVDESRRVVGKCDAMIESMNKMRQEMMSGMSEQERAMMQQMMQSRTPSQGPKVVKSGSKQIAGYSTECHKIGEAREVCTSEKLLKEIESEMGGSSFMDLQAKFGQSGNRFGLGSPEQDALLRLYKQGFPMEDKQKVAAIPGMNPAMLQFIPQAQREEIMKQMGAAGGGETVGSSVVRVEKISAMPKFDTSGLKSVSFEDYIQQMMGAMGGGPHRR